MDADGDPCPTRSPGAVRYPSPHNRNDEPVTLISGPHRKTVLAVQIPMISIGLLTIATSLLLFLCFFLRCRWKRYLCTW
jgi:hypothetical protein